MITEIEMSKMKHMMSWQTLFLCVVIMFYVVTIIINFHINWQPYGELLFYVTAWLCAVAVYFGLRNIIKQKSMTRISEIIMILTVTAILASLSLILALSFLSIILMSFFVLGMITIQDCIKVYHALKQKMKQQ